MDSSDLAEQRPNDPSRPSAKDAGSSDSTPPGASQSNRPDSEPSSSSSQRHMPNNQDQQYPFNEVTPIVSNSGSPGRGYQATDNPKNTESRQGNGNPKAPAQRETRNNDDNDPGDNPNIDQQGAWYSRVADRFSSVELENKGSVARDHLALGMLIQHSLFLVLFANNLYRTNIPRMAQDITSICLYRDSSNATFPLELDRRINRRRNCRRSHHLPVLSSASITIIY